SARARAVARRGPDSRSRSAVRGIIPDELTRAGPSVWAAEASDRGAGARPGGLRLSRGLLGHAHREVGRRLHAAVAGALHADDVMAGPGEAVDRLGVAPGVVRPGVAVRPHQHLRAAVAEVPRLVADPDAEGPHLERHRVARPDAERGGVAGVDRRGELLRLP